MVGFYPQSEKSTSQFIHAFSDLRLTFDSGKEAATPSNSFRNYTQNSHGVATLAVLGPGVAEVPSCRERGMEQPRLACSFISTT